MPGQPCCAPDPTAGGGPAAPDRRPLAPSGRQSSAPRQVHDGARPLSSPRSRLDDRGLLARLIAFDTTSCLSNLPLADFLADYLDLPGIRVIRNPSPDGAKANLVVRLGPEAEDRD